MAPVAVTDKVDPTVLVPRLNAPLLTSVAALLPLLFKPTLPVKLLLALFKLITPAPAFTVTAPALAAWVMLPTCDTPTPVKPKVPVPTLEVPIDKLIPLLVTATLLAPLLLSEIAPVKT